MDSSTTSIRLLNDLGPLALLDPERARTSRPAGQLADRCKHRRSARETDSAVRTCTTDRARRLIDGGWRFDELERVVDLQAAGTGARDVLADVVTMIDGEEAWWGDRSWLAAFLERVGDSRRAVVAVAAFYAVVSRLEPLPLFDAADDPDVDDGVLRKVRALLAKAESTQFESEAEALTAKAQDLITRHALDELSIDPSQRQDLRSRRIALDAPYVNAKSILLTEIAAANRCRSVICKFTESAIVIGMPADLSAVELLYTSLLTQATRSMLAAGTVADARGRNRTRSFRRSFLLGFAQRVGNRLAEATAAAVDDRNEGSLLPALRARSEAVDHAVTDAFPDLTHSRVSHSNRAGYGAGDRAGATADLGAERVRGTRGSLSA